MDEKISDLSLCMDIRGDIRDWQCQADTSSILFICSVSTDSRQFWWPFWPYYTCSSCLQCGKSVRPIERERRGDLVVINMPLHDDDMVGWGCRSLQASSSSASDSESLTTPWTFAWHRLGWWSSRAWIPLIRGFPSPPGPPPPDLAPDHEHYIYKYISSMWIFYTAWIVICQPL